MNAKRGTPAFSSRQLTTISGFVLLLLIPFHWTVSFVSAATGERPNVVFILTDDQGSVDAGCYGASDLKTPHIDALAQRGVRFTQFYAAAPVCAPSRAAVLTGQTPRRAGVLNNVGTHRGDAGGLAPEKVTMAEMFREAGYATAQIGKWHLGYRPHIMPNAQGFDHSFGHMGGCIDNYSHFYYWSGPNQHDLWRNGKEIHEPGKFFGDLMVQEAKQFIQAQDEKPFFIYFAVNMPHYPYQGDQKWLDHYASLEYPRNLYAAFMSTIDDRIGQLVDVLREAGQLDNTVIVFQSDHGHSAEIRAHGGGGSNGPYRGHKFQLLEGGIRVPAMISWPGKIPAGQVRGQFATGCDWFPTLAKLVGAELPNQVLDGRDLGEVLMDPDATSPHSSFCWEHARQHAVRRGNWKLYHDGKQTYLYDIQTDPGESRDRSQQQQNVVAELKTIRQAYLADTQSSPPKP